MKSVDKNGESKPSALRWLFRIFMLYLCLRILSRELTTDYVGWHRDKTPIKLKELVKTHDYVAGLHHNFTIYSKVMKEFLQDDWPKLEAEMRIYEHDYDNFTNDFKYLEQLLDKGELTDDHREKAVEKIKSDEFQGTMQNTFIHIIRELKQMEHGAKWIEKTHIDAMAAFKESVTQTWAELNDTTKALSKQGFIFKRPEGKVRRASFNIQHLQKIQALIGGVYRVETHHMKTEDHWIFEYIKDMEYLMNPSLMFVYVDYKYQEMRNHLIPQYMKEVRDSLADFIPAMVRMKENIYSLEGTIANDVRWLLWKVQVWRGRIQDQLNAFHELKDKVLEGYEWNDTGYCDCVREAIRQCMADCSEDE